MQPSLRLDDMLPCVREGLKQLLVQAPWCNVHQGLKQLLVKPSCIVAGHVAMSLLEEYYGSTMVTFVKV